MSADLPDGVFLNLDEETYFAQDRLGSSDVVTLAQSEQGWWWSSRHNPFHTDKATPERTAGSGLHALFEGGLEVYEERFIAAPDKADFEPLAETIDDMVEALREAGLDVTGRSSWKKDLWRGAMRLNLPDYPCWPNIMEDFEASLLDEEGRPTKLVLPAVEDRMLRLMYDLALDPTRSDNASIRALFDDAHPPLAEVSILWTEMIGDVPVKRRGRLDRMYPDFDLDIKSLGNWGGQPLQFLVGDVIARRGYDIQRADHYVARQAFREHVAAGRVYAANFGDVRPLNADDPLGPWLKTVAAVESWDYVWLFYQKPEPSGRAPVLFPVRDVDGMPRSEILMHGAAKREAALALYATCVKRFGLDKPWAKIAPVHFTDEAYSPRVFLPHWIAHSDG